MIPLKDDIPTRTFPYVTILLIAVNAVLFFYQRSIDFNSLHNLIYRFGCIPYEITRGVDVDVYFNGSTLSPVISQDSGFPVHVSLVSSMFLHGSWLHMIGNMLFLYIFGDNVEDWLGHGLFLLFPDCSIDDCRANLNEFGKNFEKMAGFGPSGGTEVIV